MDVHELRHLADIENNSKTMLFNPLLTDFSVNFNNGDGSKEYTIKAREIAEFPTPVAKHIKKHLIDAVFNKRELDRASEENLREITEEIEVHL